ncbi:thioredoxin family protein [Flagellimonas maritima]|nr:thioredoxin family protein [Allomuricauda aurantiaca]
MKKLLFITFCMLFGTLQAQLWQENFDAAVALANEEDKPIILVFSGSDWCAPCIRLKRKVFDSDDFKNYASSHYVLYNADFPRKKKNQLPADKLDSHKSLAEKYNPRGHFPLVVIMDKQESVLGITSYSPRNTTKEYISLLNDFLK